MGSAARPRCAWGASFVPAVQGDEMLHERLPQGRTPCGAGGGQVAPVTRACGLPGCQIFARAPAVAAAAFQSMFASTAGAWNFTRPRTAASVAV
jgi:hypothetical protein